MREYRDLAVKLNREFREGLPMSTKATASLFDTFLASHSELVEQEKPMLEATEMLARIMREKNVSRAELAKLLGKSKPFVTQVLQGKQKLTLENLATITHALGYSVTLGASIPLRSNNHSLER